MIHKDDGASSTSSTERRKRRKTKSLERRRHQNELELSDSDVDVVPAVPVPNGILQSADEVDQCIVAPKDDKIAIQTTPESKLPVAVDDIILSDKDEPLYNEILKIDETESESHNVVVDVHVHAPADSSASTCEVLEIIESDFDQRSTSPSRESSIILKLTKERELEDVPENEKENELDADEEAAKQKQTAANPSESSVANKTNVVTNAPSDFVCDKNENVNVTNVNNNHLESQKTSGKIIIEQDINHNDVVVEVTTTTNTETPVITLQNDKINEICAKNRMEVSEECSEYELTGTRRRISDSSQSSFNESDGLDTEPTYAKVDKNKKLVSFGFLIFWPCAMRKSITKKGHRKIEFFFSDLKYKL